MTPQDKWRKLNPEKVAIYNRTYYLKLVDAKTKLLMAGEPPKWYRGMYAKRKALRIIQKSECNSCDDNCIQCGNVRY